MACHRTSIVDDAPSDPVGEAVAEAVTDMLAGVSVELSYAPAGSTEAEPAAGPAVAWARSDGPQGWVRTMVLRLNDRVARLAGSREGTSIAELLEVLPAAGMRAAARFDRTTGDQALTPALRRALRDDIAAEVLAAHLAPRMGSRFGPSLIGETIEFLIELSGMRVESHDVTHGVVVADVLRHTPRLEFRYPADVRAANRAPLLFDGQRSVLVVDAAGRARTELQRHQSDRLDGPAAAPQVSHDDWVETGALVAEVTRNLGGLGFFVRADRSIWTFVDGRPLLVRRGEHWTAFPVELTASIRNMIGAGGDMVAGLIARAAILISAQPRGAILAVVDDAARLEGIVSEKDRYDLRNEIDPDAMRPETRLHHLIDAEHLDEHTLVRLSTLDGATVLDRDGRLLAYGAIVTSTDSQHEGARTAAAKTLSETAQVVLKVSVDGDITIFRAGAEVTTLLGHRRPA